MMESIAYARTPPKEYIYVYVYIYMKNWCFKFRKYKNRKGWIWFEVNELE